MLGEIAARAAQRSAPTVAIAQDWHRRVYEHVALPVDYYAGEVRDSDPRYPELDGYEVRVGGSLGMHSTLVPQALVTFEGRAQTVAGRLDGVVPPGSTPSSGTDLQAVLTLCAYLHGEWVRIHPFANGNARTARLWGNWAALRYGLPPFITVKPRPGDPYGGAALASMQGSHQLAVVTFAQMLRDHLEQRQGERL